MKEFLDLIERKVPGANPLLIVKRGSQVYGTALPESDTDYAGIYIQKIEDILGLGYKEQISDDKNDTVFYEIRRFMELLASNNPTILELLNTPEDCILYKHPSMDEILQQRGKFVTKKCANSFGGYAIQQIKKAKGQDKKQNWEKDKVIRKDILDFCYVIEEGKSIPWKEWNADRFDVKFIGAVSISNARDVYALYYDNDAYLCFSENVTEEVRKFYIETRKNSGLPLGLGYKGLIKKEEGENTSESNMLRLSSIPQGESPICTIYYNKDGYTMHCKDYLSYQEWIENRNDKRWVDVQNHGQKIDGKNMMHCRRLIEMSKEIATGKGVLVRRENAQELLDIRKGKVNLESLIQASEKDLKEIYLLFLESNLPEFVDPESINGIIINIRKIFYSSQVKK